MKINFGSKFDKQCSDMIEVCLKAMSKVMEYYKNGFDVEIKSDNSPVTDADKQSDLIIKSFLKEKYPTYAFLTEESNDDKARLNEKYVFIIDPLDGTKDFVAKDDMFAINIALVEEHTPVVGVVGIPAQNKIYFAIKDYLEERQQINTKNPYLFVSQKSINTKKPVNRNFCNRLLDKYKDACKLNELHPHLLRHFYGTNALHNAGYTIEQVASQMGHSNINTTKEYLDTEKEDMMALANKL